jgi:hypothetical protein
VNGLRSQAEMDGFPAHFQKSAKGNESTVICLRKGPLMSEDQHVTASILTQLYCLPPIAFAQQIKKSLQIFANLCGILFQPIP